MDENLNRKVIIIPFEEDLRLKMLDIEYKMEIEHPIENCIFHKWVTKQFTHPENNEFMQNNEFGLVEMPDGKMKYFRPEQIVFKKMKNENI